MENVISNTQDSNEKGFILEYSNLQKNINIENDIKRISSLHRSNSLGLSKNKSFLSNINSNINNKTTCDDGLERSIR